MKNRKGIVVVSIVLILAIATSLIFGCTAPDTTTPPSDGKPTGEVKRLSIGAIIQLTGVFSVRDVPDYNQLLVLTEIINERGGITVAGQKYMIDIVVEDGKTTMDGVTAAANKLIYDKGVKYIIGPVAFFSAAVSPICDSNKVVRFPTWNVHTPGELEASTPYAFLASNASAIEALAFAKYIRENYPDVKKVCLVTVDDGGVPYVVPKAEAALNMNGIQVVGEVLAYPNEMQDMSPMVLKINANKEADAMFQQNGLGPHVGAMVKGLREIGDNRPIFLSLPTLINEIVAIAGKDAAKNVVTNAITPTDPNLPEIAKEIIARTYAKYGEDYPLLLTAPGSLWVLTQVLEKSSSLDTDAFKAAWDSLNTVDTIFGPACISGEETFGIRHVAPPPQGIQYLDKDGNITGFLIDVGCIP